MSDPTYKEFFDALRQAKDDSLRALLRLRLEVALEIQAATQDNIRKNFGPGRAKGRSPITALSDGGTARSSGRGGGLFRSVEVAAKGEVATVSVGGTGAPYAAVHEFGATIRPKNGRYLTIPASPSYRGQRARDHDLEMGFDERWGLVLRERGSKELAYLLRRKSTIPERPYFRPAVASVQNDERLRDLLVRAAGKSLEVEIK